MILKALKSNLLSAYPQYSMRCLPLEINYAILTRRDNENQKKEKSLISRTHIYILIKIVEKPEMEYQIISKKRKKQVGNGS